MPLVTYLPSPQKWSVKYGFVLDMPLQIFPDSVQTVLIDMDGTLIDHFQALYRCYKKVAQELDEVVPSPELVKRSVGGSMPVTIRKFFSEEKIEEAKNIWTEHFEKIHLEDVVLMKGAKELLDTLARRKIKAAIFTNKTGRHTRNICQNLGLADQLELILGVGDTPYRKPQRELSQIALDKLDTDAKHTIMIGDSPFDIETARNVGMASFCVPTGSHTQEELEAAGADKIFPNLQEIANWLA